MVQRADAKSIRGVFAPIKFGSLGLTLVAAACSALTLSACGRKSSSNAGAEATTPSASTAAPVSSHPMDVAIQSIVDHCLINEENAVIGQCSGGQRQTTIRELNTGKISRPEAFLKLVAAVAATDKKRSVVGSKLLESTFRNSLGAGAGNEVSKEAAAELIGQLAKLPDRQAMQVAPSAVHAAMLTGQQAALYKVLDEHPNRDLRVTAYVYLMRYGTLNELPKIQGLVEGSDERVAASAVESLRRMPGQKAEDKTRICDFVKPLARDSRSAVAGKATAQLVTCAGEYLDEAIAAAGKAHKEATLGAAVIRGLDQACTLHRNKTAGTPEQCNKVRSLLEQVLDDTKLDADVRQFALLGLGLQFQDEATLKLAKKYAEAEDRRLRSASERVVRNLTAKLAKSTPSKSGPTQPHAGAPKPASPKPVSPKSVPQKTAPQKPSVTN